VVVITLCAKEVDVTRAFQWWDDTYYLRMPPFCWTTDQCTSMVMQSIDYKGRDWYLWTPQRWFEEYTRPATHKCGPNKGAMGQLDVLHETDWTKEPA